METQILTDEENSLDNISFEDSDLLTKQHDSQLAQLIAAGPVGVAAAAAIVSCQKRKKNFIFETNPSLRKRLQTRLLRKLKNTINEYASRIGHQATLIIYKPTKSEADNAIKIYGTKPLEDVVKNWKQVIIVELEKILSQKSSLYQNQSLVHNNQHQYELPPLVVDGIPTYLDKMTQAQLRCFIPHMLKFATGRGKPGWGRLNTIPIWWPKSVPWANVRSDIRTEQEKQKVSWTDALREIIRNCYVYYSRSDLLSSPTGVPTDPHPKYLSQHSESNECVDKIGLKRKKKIVKDSKQQKTYQFDKISGNLDLINQAEPQIVLITPDQLASLVQNHNNTNLNFSKSEIGISHANNLSGANSLINDGNLSSNVNSYLSNLFSQSTLPLRLQEMKQDDLLQNSLNALSSFRIESSATSKTTTSEMIVMSNQQNSLFPPSTLTDSTHSLLFDTLNSIHNQTKLNKPQPTVMLQIQTFQNPDGSISLIPINLVNTDSSILHPNPSLVIQESLSTYGEEVDCQTATTLLFDHLISQGHNINTNHNPLNLDFEVGDIETNVETTHAESEPCSKFQDSSGSNYIILKIDDDLNENSVSESFCQHEDRDNNTENDHNQEVIGLGDLKNASDNLRFTDDINKKTSIKNENLELSFETTNLLIDSQLKIQSSPITNMKLLPLASGNRSHCTTLQSNNSDSIIPKSSHDSLQKYSVNSPTTTLSPLKNNKEVEDQMTDFSPAPPNIIFDYEINQEASLNSVEDLNDTPQFISKT
ncbi:uncharacterized protein LOC135923560 isoform X2 [Gordionus sp. m RMFG-2023]|uniref:uncharacterized protein LOC135923560 isoform X2 n=1 Tax=Gordionus sp. m RMFG-2023 TaxID=3053472 RepID=UPI0031FC6060